ncbi:gamete expressed 1-like protein isoform X1 [Tanacetum coccineum]
MAPLPHSDLRHPWLRYQVAGYTEDIVHSYEWRLETIWDRSVNRVHILDFEGLTPKMRQDLAVRLRMVYAEGDGLQPFVSHAWRRLFGIRGPLVRDFILKFLSTYRMSDTEMGLDVARLHTEEKMAHAGFGAYWSGSERFVPDKGDMRDYWIKISSDRDFLGAAPSYVYIKDPMRILYHKMITCTISGHGQGPEKHAEGRKSGARLSGGHFIGRLAEHFGLVSDEGLRDHDINTKPLDVTVIGFPNSFLVDEKKTELQTKVVEVYEASATEIKKICDEIHLVECLAKRAIEIAGSKMPILIIRMLQRKRLVFSDMVYG